MSQSTAVRTLSRGPEAFPSSVAGQSPHSRGGLVNWERRNFRPAVSVSSSRGATHVETPMPRKAGFLVVVIGLVVLTTTHSARAKGSPTPRGYAVVEGPGLAHPIVISAPWSAAKLGYFGVEAEIFINFVTFTGAIPGVSTTSSQTRPAESLGPAYRVTYFNDCCSSVSVNQVLYPYATPGPWIYTPPSQQPALARIFGRLDEPPAPPGWVEARGSVLLDYLRARGLPQTAPAVRVPTDMLARAFRDFLLAALVLAALLVLLTILAGQARRRTDSSDPTIRAKRRIRSRTAGTTGGRTRFPPPRRSNFLRTRSRYLERDRT
jgi:hypothetical protein